MMWHHSADTVEKANKPNIVDLEAVGHAMDLIGIERRNEKGGASARASGAIFQLVEAEESARRQTRFDKLRLRRSWRWPTEASQISETRNQPCGPRLGVAGTHRTLPLASKFTCLYIF